MLNKSTCVAKAGLRLASPGRLPPLSLVLEWVVDAWALEVGVFSSMLTNVRIQAVEGEMIAEAASPP